MKPFQWLFGAVVVIDVVLMYAFDLTPFQRALWLLGSVVAYFVYLIVFGAILTLWDRWTG